MRRSVKKSLGFALTLATVVGLSPASKVNAAQSYTVTTTTTLYTVTSVGGTRDDSGVDVDYVVNPNNGPTLGLLHIDANGDTKNDYLLEVVDGEYTYAFKDMNKNGILDEYEDWRLDDDTRALSLATELSSTDDGIKKIAGLMLFSSHERDSYTGLTDAQVKYLSSSYVRNITDAAGNNVKDAVGWTNAMQAYVEASDFNVPVDFSSDPRSTAGSGDLYSAEADGSGISAWPSNIGMAATFDTDHMYNFAKATSAEYRALGIVTALGPQIDLATEPRWIRVGGTFGENTKLATDMAQAYVDGSQSTYAADGSDLGWGKDSINAMIKHFPGDGAGEGGRESHMNSGKYAVYPGNNFDEHLIPFKDGGLNLAGATGEAAAVMTSYSIGVNADGTPVGGEAVGSAYSKYKMDILRDTFNYDGVVCTDWGVTSMTSGFGMAWGVEDKSVAERHYLALEAGTDMFGGNNDSAPVIEAFNMMVAKDGDAYARTRFARSAKRLLKLTMQTGAFENPYVDLDTALASAGSADKMADGYAAQLDSIVMLKNKDNTIKSAATTASNMNAQAASKAPADMTVYIPMTYTKEIPGAFGPTPAAWSESMNLAVARTIYGTVITDELQGDGTYKVPDLSNVDKVIVGMRSPLNGTPFSKAGLVQDDDGNNVFYPLSLQYAPYTANGDAVRKTSIAGDTLGDGSKENRSYYGETSRLFNEYDLTAFNNAVAAVEATGKDIPVIVSMNASGTFIPAEFEAKADAIVTNFSVSDKAVFDVIEGKHEPRGLLPLQLPANMETVEANQEDVAGDLVCYKDSMGNTYDVAYGLNWSGLIDDARVQKYNASRPVTDTPTNPTNPTNPTTPNVTKPSTDPKKNGNVGTGDTTNYASLIALLSISLVTIVAAFSKKYFINNKK